MRPFELTEEHVLGLPVDELALEVLRDLVANEETGWNSSSWILLASGSGHSAAAISALKEAFQWLHANGLLAEDLGMQGSLHAIFVTRLGHKVASEGLAVARAIQRLTMDLHPTIEAKVRRQYLMGEYELAAFAAMKAVEVRVRELSDAPSSSIGRALVHNAFGTNGPLRNPDQDPGEQTSRMELFAGALGTFKNPTSHRNVEYENPTEAAEVILLADLLLRLLDRVEAEVRYRRQIQKALEMSGELNAHLRAMTGHTDTPDQ